MDIRFPINTTNNLITTGCEIAKFITAEPLQEMDNPWWRMSVELKEGCQLNEEIQALLQRFNNGVEGSFANGGVDGLRELTTPTGFERMQGRYASWRERGVKALNLVWCQFFCYNVLPGAQTMEAFTREKWQFVYEDGREVFTNGNVDGYDLTLVDGEWRVERAVTYAREE